MELIVSSDTTHSLERSSGAMQQQRIRVEMQIIILISFQFFLCFYKIVQFIIYDYYHCIYDEKSSSPSRAKREIFKLILRDVNSSWYFSGISRYYY